jgi:hypothetical protein
MIKRSATEPGVQETSKYADKIRSVYVERKQRITSKVDRAREEISAKIRARLAELNEQMTKFFEWLKTIKKARLDPEQQENLRRIIDFQCGRIRKKVDSLYRWNEEAQKVPEKDEESEEE